VRGKFPLAWFEFAGALGLFGLKAVQQSFRRPFEFEEVTRQLFEIGWRSGLLVIVTGFALGMVLALQTRSAMAAFGAQAMIPQAISEGLFRDVGPIFAGLIISGRVGAGIGAELAEMRVSEQIDALESVAVDSFKYLVVTRITACVLALPILTTILNFSGILGGMISESVAGHVPFHLFLNQAFGPMSWSDYIPFTATCLVFGFIIGLVSCFLGYTATQGAAGVGRASTGSVVLSSLLIILSEVILVKLILFWYP
jgi:phospholipid/cholesterol/gamma-HCH transport system permease protein